MPGLTSFIGYGTAPPVGSSARGSSFYYAAAGETNGNFIAGPYAFDQTTYPNEAYAARIYGDVRSTTPDNWLNSSIGGIWTDGTQWSSGSPPSNGTDAVFNLSSPGGYTVELRELRSPIMYTCKTIM